MEITTEQLQEALDFLGIAVPHNTVPGAYPGGMKMMWNEAEWNSMSYDPPEGLILGHVYSATSWGEPALVENRANFLDGT